MSATPPAHGRPRPGPVRTTRPGLTALVLALFLGSRLAVALIPFGGTPYPSGHLVINDVRLYATWATDLWSGAFPALDPMWQYPPLAAPLFMLGAVAPDATVGFIGLAFLADAAAMIALLVAARRSGRFAGAWLWAGAALIVGPVFLTRFDVFPTAAVMAGLLIVATRPAFAGALIGLGAALKVWPLLAMSALRRAALPAGIAGFATVLVLTSAAMWAWFGANAVAFLSGQSERGLQVESVAALPFVVGHAFGADVPSRFRYGSMELDVVGAGAAATVATVVGLVLLAWVAVARLRGRLDHLPGADVAFTAVLISVVTSRVFSPQYSIWLVGIGAVCLTSARTRMRLPVLLVSLAAVITQVIYPPLYAELIAGFPLATTLQVARIALVVAALAIALRRVLGAQPAATSSGSRPASSSESRSEITSQPQNSSIQALPAMPISRARSGSPSNSTMRSATAAGSPPGTT
ncbi:MAG: hypothetical protein QG597_2050 [Actinomycetota bacterium]|nr:hypothetical protein [Actinomycetota bacterium]